MSGHPQILLFINKFPRTRLITSLMEVQSLVQVLATSTVL